MYPSALPIMTGSLAPSGPYAPVWWRAVLLDARSMPQWQCEHAHYADRTAQDCAEYEKQRRLRGGY